VVQVRIQSKEMVNVLGGKQDFGDLLPGLIILMGDFESSCIDFFRWYMWWKYTKIKILIQ